MPPVPTPPEFEEFWAAYPRKVGKLDAEKAWAQTAGKRPPLPRILEGLARCRRSPGWRENGGEFIPHPATWLRRGGWDDFPEEKPGPREPDLDTLRAQAAARVNAAYPAEDDPRPGPLLAKIYAATTPAAIQALVQGAGGGA